MKKKIIITGGSGFIGTNLVQHYLVNDYEVLNLDVNPPKQKEHYEFWKKIDVNIIDGLQRTVLEFKPDYLIHLAARTDLDGKTLDDYVTNITGVSNLVSVLKESSTIKRVVFASTQLVCHGRMPIDDDDYNPINFYGESKMIGEKIVRNDSAVKFPFAFIRPTSIWGPWFGVPYRNFFDMLMKRKYFHIGRKSCTKTYGYIENSIYQIDQVLLAPIEKVKEKVFYLGDYSPYNIEEWADEIARELNFRVKRLPYSFIWLLAKLGDALKHVNVNFPMTTFRLKNMTTKNIIDMSATQKIAPNLPVDRKVGVHKTLKWIENY